MSCDTIAACECHPAVSGVGAVLQTGNTSKRITCSTLAEAEFFANGGFDDILYACPITPDKLPQAASLANRRCVSVGKLCVL